MTADYRERVTDLRYAAVTPARNEAANLPRLAESLAAQELLPAAWVIVDNGSTDETLSYARSLERRYGWVVVVDQVGEPVATRGAPVARAFMAGLAALPAGLDVVVKLDADVSFDERYFRRLLDEFRRDPELGIAGGTCYELEGEEWVPRHVTAGKVRGATRAYRWSCLQDVLPLEERSGWDGIDELRAHAAGWRTASFADLRFLHHRRLGARDAKHLRQRLDHGRSAHYMGYRFPYLVARSLFRAYRDPAALAMIAGYLYAAAAREPRLPDVAAREHARRGQRLRELPRRVGEALGRRSASRAAVRPR